MFRRIPRLHSMQLVSYIVGAPQANTNYSLDDYFLWKSQIINTLHKLLFYNNSFQNTSATCVSYAENCDIIGMHQL
jgi:hypothetical protein